MNNNHPNHTVATERDNSGQDATRHDMSRQEIEAPHLHNEPDITRPTIPHDPKTLDGFVATANDEARQDATERDQSGQVATGRDRTRQVPTEMADQDTSQSTSLTAENEAEAKANNWLDIEETRDRLREHEITRSPRSVQRYCKRGELNCRLVPTETGTRYLVAETSIEDFIKTHDEKMPSGDQSIVGDVIGREAMQQSNDGNSEPSLASSNPGENVKAKASIADPVTTSTSPSSEHAQEIITLKNEQIEMLQCQLSTANRQLQVKDEQIITMLERDHETNVLIHNLQDMMQLPSASTSAEPQSQPLDLNNTTDVSTP